MTENLCGMIELNSGADPDDIPVTSSFSVSYDATSKGSDTEEVSIEQMFNMLGGSLCFEPGGLLTNLA